MRLQLGVLVFYEGSDDYSIRLLKQNTVETVVLLTHRNVKADSYVDVSLDMDEYRKMTNKG